MPKIYCGVGARSTPNTIQLEMRNVALELAAQGWLLRSGHADGADKAFEAGCDRGKGQKEIWLPWVGFNGSASTFILPRTGPVRDRAFEIAESVHPAWERCNLAARCLHARNVLQVLGADFETPADKVICWTPDGRVAGGTATALWLAEQHGIPIDNLALRGE